MPGVPSSKGCNACRKQRKKCDIEKSPCSRCARLKIPCIGQGQQRWKFKNETIGTNFLVETSPARVPFTRQDVVVRLTNSPTNQMTTLRSALVDRIDVKSDIRYQLTWNYGVVLLEIPRRLGHSPALDAASDALVTAHARFCRGMINSDESAIVKHGRALRALRNDLNDDVKARSTETLAAIWLIMINQTFIDPGHGLTCSHSKGVAQILKSRGRLAAQDDPFEKILLATLRGPLVVEALTNDTILFTPQEYKELVENELEGYSLDSKWLKIQARLPHLMRKGREALKDYLFPSPARLKLVLEMDSLREEMKANIQALRARLQGMSEAPIVVNLVPHYHALYLKSLAMALGTGIVMNCILSALVGDSTSNHEESSQWSEELMQLGKIATQYAPLGSFAMIIALRFAWLGAKDVEAKAKTLTLLQHYQCLCVWKKVPAESLLTEMSRLEKRFALLGVYEGKFDRYAGAVD